jgi:hypothetical protein
MGRCGCPPPSDLQLPQSPNRAKPVPLCAFAFDSSVLHRGKAARLTERCGLSVCQKRSRARSAAKCIMEDSYAPRDNRDCVLLHCAFDVGSSK